MHFYIDESGFNQSRLSMLSCVVSEEPDHLREEIIALKDDIEHNQRYSSIIGNFHENGFHYAENPYEFRNEFIHLLSRLTFESYICFVDEAQHVGHRNELYDLLFRKLITDRIRDHRDQEISICFEQHDSRQSKRLEELQAIALEIDGKVKAFHHINDVAPPVILSAGKEEPCLAIADYVCGVFTDYYKKYKSNEKLDGEPFEARNFDDLRGKIRLIQNYGTNDFYSRHNPFPRIP